MTSESLTFVLVPGAGGAGEVYWREVVAELESRGHAAIAVDIAADDPALGLPEYAAITDDAIGDHRDVVLVAQSMGGFTVPMIDKLNRVSRIVLVNAMVPLPGETPDEWGTAVGQHAAFAAAAAADGRPAEFDMDAVFLHDIPDDVKAGMAEGDREPAQTPFGQPATFERWPDVPTHVLVGADDRLFPADFQARVAQDRLGLDADVMPGGHLVAKSRPVEVVERLLGYAGDVPFDLGAAAAGLSRVVSAVRDDQLDDPTPCDAWTVRRLLGHVLALPHAFLLIARHQPVPDADESTELPAGWREDFARALLTLVGAWRAPEAWTGESTAAGFTGSNEGWAAIVLDELVLHAWDLARATGQDVSPSDSDVEVCTGFANEITAAVPEGQGPFGPAVAVADGADAFTRLLGLAGRDPAWVPAT